MIASCSHLHGYALFICYLNRFALVVAIIRISLIGSNGGNRCLCKVGAGGAQSNNSVGAQHKNKKNKFIFDPNT